MKAALARIQAKTLLLTSQTDRTIPRANSMSASRTRRRASAGNMLRLNGCNPRGERLVSDAPMGHWETVTFIAGLRQTGIVAPMLIKGAMNGEPSWLT